MTGGRVLLILVSLYGMSCANIQGITGGPEDRTAPNVLDDKSSPNYQTRFNGREIVLSFDEWIRLDNPSGNISISPPTQFPVDYKLKGKQLRVVFDKREQLLENTSYSIQFGESIKDITAGNIQRNIRYVFSTGAYVDSLSVSGKVFDAYTLKAKDKVLVSLYKVLDDTVFQKIKPFYFSWTDTAGSFRFRNLSPGKYRLYALEDKNQSYTYDQTSEAFAFLNTAIDVVDKDTSDYQLGISAAALPLIIKDRKNAPGETKLFFNRIPSTVKLNSEPDRDLLFVNLKDSLLIWNTGSTELRCVLKYEDKSDTLVVMPLLTGNRDSIRYLQLEKTLIKPGEYPVFVMNYPVQKIDEHGIRSLDSLIQFRFVTRDSIDPRKFSVVADLPANKLVKLVFNQAAILGLHNSRNKQDTFSFRLMDKSALSKLTLRMDHLESGIPYIFQLLNGDVLAEGINFKAAGSTKTFSFANLIPGKYKLRLIHDRNLNGQWDPANFAERIQAEQVWYFDLPDLRADWDVEATIKL